MRMTLSQLSVILGGDRQGDDVSFASVSTDTRSLEPGQLFVALRGERFDGHAYLEQAFARGASSALIQQGYACAGPCVQIADTRLGLGQLGSAWRAACAPRMVGITGSNGKTTVKEMIAAILSEAGPTLATAGNLNNDIGVPLTLLKLSGAERYAVIEMGANHRGEIGYVANLAKPDVAIITNAGAAHLEGFGGLEGVAYGKGELIGSLGSEGTAVLNADDRYFPLWRQMAGSRRVITFGWNTSAEFRCNPETVAVDLGDEGFATSFRLQARDQETDIKLRLAGRHNVLNAVAAAAVSSALDLSLEIIRRGLAKVSPVKGRMECLNVGGSIVINDTYNANPSSFGAALNALRELPGEHWVVVGDFGELGEDSLKLHAEVGSSAHQAGVTRLYAVGEHTRATAQSFGANAKHFPNQDALITQIAADWRTGLVVLVKGSRSQTMEHVVMALQKTIS